MSSLSVVLAVYNEEKNLAKCLEAVKSLADEIVIVDGGSTDRTVEIAENFKAKVKITDNPAIFHINKQKAIDLASGDWILQLDADEIVTSNLAQEIKKAIISSEFQAYWLKRQNFFLGRVMKKTGMYPDPVIRLFKRGKGYLPCKSVHEQMIVNGKIGWLTNDLLHYPYPDFSEYLRKSNSYTTLTALEYKNDKIGLSILTLFNYYYLKPLLRFIELYFRHKGFLDGIPGLVFSFYSGLHIRTSYIKYWELIKKNKK